jgi:predicted transglutaminase-like cysteine proteinase
MAIRSSSYPILTAFSVALALAPGSVSAQALTGTATSLAWSKSEAILGAPSALQAVLTRQQGGASAAAVAPASYSIPRTQPAALRKSSSDDGVLSGKPDVFGSVALRVSHTPLDTRWRAVEHAPVTGAPARFAAALQSVGAVAQLELVNRYVNRQVHYVDDERRFGRPDVWSSANETLRSRRGDCEDYAIAKLQLLRAAGFRERDLYLVIAHDLVRRADHAVVVARAPGHMYVLDDGTNELLESKDVSDYRPMLTFASYGEWTHGYRVQRAPVVIAEKEGAPDALAADDQRSRSASLLAFNTGFKR